jgi:hypothetical protein
MAKKSKAEENVTTEVAGMSFSASSVIVTDDAVYKIDLLPANFEEAESFEDNIAYLNENYYYIYRGAGNPATKENKKPGIYLNKGGNPKFFIVEPETDEEKQEYNAMQHVVSLVPMSVIDSANTKEELLVAIPESTKIFQPQITENDDILKLIAKKTLLAKNVDLDRYKDRFTNKNELFNFKQVLRGDNKLSMKIFNRGMEAMNLEYVIIVREKSTDDIVGDALTNPVVVSSEETYAL